MTAAGPRPASRSAIVLAGGDGARLRAFTEEWLGSPRPKQYCAFVGTRSMFDHTLDRAAQWCAPRHIVSVVGAHHAPLIAARPIRRTDGHFVFQPANRNTAPRITSCIRKGASCGRCGPLARRPRHCPTV